MKARLIAAPFEATAPTLGTVLKESLNERAFSDLEIVVAWVKRSGLRLIAADMLRFRKRGSRVRAIVGIDERGATRQGLEMIRANCDEVLVYRDPAGGTFHPKIYLFRGKGVARLIVGSSNVTRGGFYDNYEASICLDLDLPADADLLQSAEKYLELLRGQTEVALELSDDLKARLDASPLVQDEDKHRSSPAADSESKAPILPFGKVISRKVPSPVTGTTVAGAKKKAPPVNRRVGRTVAESQPAQIEKRWFKELGASDAQQPPGGGTNITGVLRLTKAGFDIDQTTFFRSDLLKGAKWQKTLVSKKPAERASIDFDVRIEQRYLGRRRLVVSHASHREAAQGNVTTVLHWGDLSEEIRKVNRTGSWAVIDVDEDGRFGLSIQKARPSTV